MKQAAWLLAALLIAGCERPNGTPEDHAAHGGSAPSGTPTAPAAAPADPHAGHAPAPAPADPHAGHAPAPAPADPHAGHAEMAAPPGYVSFTLTPERAAGMGLATTPVAERDFKRVLRTTGVVTLDETRTSHVHSKVRGWIEKVSADFVGKQVRAGTPLCTVYSQEVYAAQLEFLSILEQAGPGTTLSGPFAQAERAAREQLVAASRRRLALWDVPPAEIERLERTREPRRTFTLTAPRSGLLLHPPTRAYNQPRL